MAAVKVVTEGPFSGHGEVFRSTKGFKPSSWGDLFTCYDLQNEEASHQFDEAIDALKEEIRSMLLVKESKTSQKIILIDTIERLGLSYHFEKEIDEQLKRIFDELNSNVKSGDEDNDLFNTSLQFRLFRQHGYNISCSAFEKFKDKDNKFIKTMSSDIDGLLSFYEASELRFQGEDILEEAMAYTTYHLSRVRFMLDSPLREKVSQALENSFHKGVPILETRQYISIYEKEITKNQLLLRLAKLNFQFLQNLYKKELYDLSRWYWKELDLTSNIPYARSRVVECYLWAVMSHFEPQYSFARSAYAKSLVLLTVIDDTFDTYGTLDELDIFMQALQRWDIKEMDRLPEYMKVIYKLFLNTYEEFEHEASKQERSFSVSYAIKAMKRIVQAYHTEAHWFKKKHVPTFEDALSHVSITGGSAVLLTASLMNFNCATKQDLEWVMNQPKIVVVASLICRFMNDIGSYQRESKDGQTSAIDYYMKQHGVSKQDAVLKLVEIIEDSWMTMNKEWIETTSIPRKILKLALNYARASHATYKYGDDGYTNPETTLKPLIVALFVDPIII